MIEQDPKKKKRGLLSPLSERMGLDQTTEYNTPNVPKTGLGLDTESENTGVKTVADEVRNRMTGR